jgi:integrase
MLRVYKVGILHEHVTRNPVHRIIVPTCAATALRSSELLALRWADVLWEQERIAVTKRWSVV